LPHSRQSFFPHCHTSSDNIDNDVAIYIVTCGISDAQPAAPNLARSQLYEFFVGNSLSAKVQPSNILGTQAISVSIVGAAAEEAQPPFEIVSSN
jgi:hypothetical protein